MPVELVQRYTYASQVPKWRQYLHQKHLENYKQREKWEYYIADILNSLSLLIDKVPTFRQWQPRRRKRSEFLIDFNVEEKQKKPAGWADGQRAIWAAIRRMVKGK